MSDVTDSIDKVAASIDGKDKKRGILDFIVALAPFLLAFLSLWFTMKTSKADREDKQLAAVTAQMEAATKVLPYLSDSLPRKNVIALITLSNYHQDSLAIKLIPYYPFEVQQQVAQYIHTNSTDPAAREKAKSILVAPGLAAILTARNELAQNAREENKANQQNMGKFVKKYNAIAGLGEGSPWAATFVCWCYNNSITYFSSSANILALEEEFKKSSETFSKIDTARSGDIYFYNWDGVRAMGLVDSISKYTPYPLWGIEGKSSPNDKPPFDQVASVKFSVAEIGKDQFTFVRVRN